MNATLLADGWHGGPGPWILLVPLFWFTAVMVIRRVVFRAGGFRRGPGASGAAGTPPWAGRAPWAGYGPQASGPAPAPSPIETLNRRYAEGAIDEFEYRERYDLLAGAGNPPVTDQPTDGKR
ncbi:SHOCT domain-containing protein [Streptacidiphilus sp. EB129]|uniref:SHOCT domain-containing protein n=1 Tax=Streptacidiphilus sp. EB129 TaxID=3156262 RepID=UPI003512F0F7